MLEIPVEMLQIDDGGRAMWLHDENGSTVMRLQTTGIITLNHKCTNNCPHVDIRVSGDIEICVPPAWHAPIQE